MVTLSIIILNYNVRYFLEQCLQSVQEACENLSYEIIVIDNNSTDGSTSLVQQSFPEVTLLQNEVNIGFAKGNNQGVKKAKGKYVLILNPDTIITKNAIHNALNFAEKKATFGAIGVRFIDGAGNFLPESKRNIPTIKIATEKLKGRTSNYYANAITESSNSSVEILTGAFLLMRRERYLNIGGFDESYFMYGEDIDLCYRLLNQGFQNYYLGENLILHYKGESTTRNFTHYRNFYGAMQIFYKKHFPVSYVSKLFSQSGFYTLIFWKSALQRRKKEKDTGCKKILYVGKDHEKYEKIRSHFSGSFTTMTYTIPTNFDGDFVLFDNALMRYSEIMKNFELPIFKNCKKRIIPKGENYFLGSDSSCEKGEVQFF